MTDYYNILGISKNASNEDIKNAYRRLARTHHPDKGGDKDKFQKIQEAYETLSNSDKRNQYDNPIQSDFENMFPFGFDHPFFKHHREQRQSNIVKKNDHIYTCKITLNEVFFGTTKKLKVHKNLLCKKCILNCIHCNGTGTSTKHIQMGPFTQVIQQTCTACKGNGKTNDKSKQCESCNSKGVIIEEKIFEIQIEQGIENGKKFIFDGWGEQAVKENEKSGDFIVVILIDEHPVFKREGLNLIIDIKLSFTESIIGKIITIPFFTGNLIIDTRGFGIINPNKEYIIHEKGLKYRNQCGVLKLKFNIDYPERTFNENDIVLLKNTFDTVNLA
jgi:DnaJ family protein A protein 2